MFTIEQIREAHANVKSGADFPAFIAQLRQLGVTYYETFVKDGHTDYRGADGYRAVAPPKYDAMAIGESCREEAFRRSLKAHQEGKSDYPAFITESAELGVEKWAVDLERMTCTYYDKQGREVLVEKIPA